MSQKLLHDFIIEKHIKNALEEDIGYGDITTDSLYDANDEMTAVLTTREDGILCGTKVFDKVFSILDPEVEITWFAKDGTPIKKGQKLAELKGPARAILTGERTALNYVQRMSGIATETAKYQQAIAPYEAKITDTRKNTPGFRYFEKYAVQTGGARLHRFNLCDCVMIKDHHIRHTGSIPKAL